jgi:hypothetical protein
MADVVSIFMMTKWFHYHVLCSANRGLRDEWNDTTQLLLDAARNAQSPELLQVLAQNPLFQYSVFFPTRICLPDEGIYVVCVCVCVCVFVCALVFVFVFAQSGTDLVEITSHLQAFHGDQF